MYRSILFGALFVAAISLGLPAAAKSAGQGSINVPETWSKPTKNFKVAFPEVDTSALPPKLAKEVERGEYLARISDCMACHTEHDENTISGKPFAGGLPLPTPFGTVYSRNITPDEETGIGSWTFAQFDRAVRYGVSPHGFLLAAMPYNNYNHMSREQVHAIWEYLKRVPAVHRKDEPLDLIPPLNWRWLQFGWRVLFFQPIVDTWHWDPEHPYDANRSKLWNRGHFLVQGPAHCGTCHTPHSLLGAPKRSHPLVGSAFAGAWAPYIAGAVTSVYPVHRITRVFKKARMLSGGKATGPMLDAITNSLQYLTPRDMRAVAVYIQSVSAAPSSGAEPVSRGAVSLAVGQQTYKTTCAACHATGIGGAPKVGNVEDWKPITREPLYAVYRNVVHGVSIMPPKGGCKACTSRQITSAIVYMMYQSQPGGERKAKSVASNEGKSGGTIPGDVVSLAVGKQVYHKVCAACHATGVLGAPRFGVASQWTERLKLGLDTLHENALTGIGAMPPKGGCTTCTDRQIISAVNYILAHSGGKQLLAQTPGGKH